MRCSRLLFTRRLILAKVFVRKADLVIVGVLLFESVEIQLPNKGRVVVVAEVFGQQIL